MIIYLVLLVSIINLLWTLALFFQIHKKWMYARAHGATKRQALRMIFHS